MKTALAFLLVVVAGCSNSAPTLEETDPPATGRYTDAEQAAILSESIDIVYAGDPQPAWFPYFTGLSVEDGTANVMTTLTQAEADLADSICRDIAAITHDDDAEPIGVREVVIRPASGQPGVHRCEVPEQ